MSTCERFDALDELPRALQPEEQAELDAHVAACRGCAALRDLGPTLRADTEPDPEDAARIEAALVRARDGAHRRRRRLPATSAMLVAAVVVVASGALAAWRVFSGGGAAVDSKPPETSGAQPPALQPGAAVAPSAELAPPPPPSSVPAPTAEARRPLPPSATAAASAPASAAPVVDEPSAAALLAEANAHRRRGATQQAIASYRDLVARFPGSREEITSRVMFGNLLLDSDPALALARFDGYLAAATSGALAEEARLGRAVALDRLARDADAREAWRDLLRQFPASVHSARARARLGEP
jgi:hypothetical protein